MSDAAQFLAGVLTSIVFIVFGYLQFTSIGAYTNNPAVVKFVGTIGGVVPPLVIAYLVAAVDLFGGLLILLGYQTRIATVVLIIFVILTIFFAHPFWNFEGAPRAANQVQFYKNLVIVGALIMLFVHGPGRYSLDNRFVRS
jgi:putative oxidoreductase